MAVKLTRWPRGFAVCAPGQEERTVYFWFYEWHLFDAVDQGQHTPGRSDFPWLVGDERAIAQSGGIRIEV